MELVRLACDGCGADLELPRDARFVTCRFCDARLEVRRTESAAFTRVREAVERVERRTAKLSKEVRGLRAENRVLALEKQLDDVDRAWDEREGALMNRHRDGSSSVPSRLTAQGIGVAVVLLALVLLVALPSAEGVSLALVVAVAGVGLAAHQHSRAVRFELAVGEHLARRDELEQRLAKARRRARRR
jgi:LSD1 subclass zinc finger protein